MRFPYIYICIIYTLQMKLAVVRAWFISSKHVHPYLDLLWESFREIWRAGNGACTLWFMFVCVCCVCLSRRSLRPRMQKSHSCWPHKTISWVCNIIEKFLPVSKNFSICSFPHFSYIPLITWAALLFGVETDKSRDKPSNCDVYVTCDDVRCFL